MASEPGSIGQGAGGSPRRQRRWVALLPPLLAALACTGLIVEAIYTAMRSRANGDLMLLFLPILGAVFFSIPAFQAWYACLRILRGR